MADPFSIVAGTAGILEISWRLVSYLGKIKSAASKIERDLAALSFEVNALIGVTESIQCLWNDYKEKHLDTLSPDAKRIMAGDQPSLARISRCYGQTGVAGRGGYRQGWD